MHELATIWLLATVVGVHSNVSNQYFWKQGSQNNACNWTVQVFCENSFVIDILDVNVSYISCTDVCSTCTGSDVSGTSTVDNITSIQRYIMDECHNLSSCNTSLPYPVDMKNRNMTHVTVHYICTENLTDTDTDIDTSTSKEVNGTSADLSTSPPAPTNGDRENTTGSDTNTDTSTLTVTKVTTVGVDSSPPALTNGDTENTTGTEKQSSSVNIVVAVVPTVLLLVAISLVTVVIIARQKQRRTKADDKTSIRSEFDTNMLHDGASSEATPSLNVNGIRHSTMAADIGDYNTINLITFTVTGDPTYNHVNCAIVDSQYGRPNLPQLTDSDYASCADIDETAFVDHPYSHTINNTHTSNEINSNQGLTDRVSWSDYDHIELKKFNGNHSDETTTGDSPSSHSGTHLLKGRFLVDVDQCGDYYSHIGQVGQATDADSSKNQQSEVADARSSSYIMNTCETGTASKVDYENNESRDILDSKENTRGNVNVNELNGGEIHPQYQVKECDDSCESSHSYFILEKMQ